MVVVEWLMNTCVGAGLAPAKGQPQGSPLRRNHFGFNHYRNYNRQEEFNS